MATGIQTGIRRGSRPLTAANQSEKTRMARCLASWNALSKAAKASIIAAALVLQIGVVGVGLYSNHSALVDLYPTKLNSRDIPEISRALLDMGIEHEVSPSNDSVLLARPDRIRARAGLASRNLPLHSLLTADQVSPDMVRTASERAAVEQRVLESEITLALRDVDGVQDARVKLALPPRRYLSSEQDVTRASVTLQLEPGYQLTRQSIGGLTNLVAFSVPGLSPENVSLLDTRGIELSKMAQRGPEGEATSAHFEVRSAEEARNQEKLQKALDIVMPGRTRVVVNMDLDFSEKEHRLYTPGSEKDDGLVRSSFQLVTEMLDSEKGGNQKKDFETEKRSENYKFKENYIAWLEKAARVERVSAVIFADGASPEEAAALRETAKGALGMKDSRGDSVFVNTTPWDHTLMETPDPALLPPTALDEADTAPLSTRGILGLLALQTVLMAGGVAAFAYAGSRRSAPEVKGLTLTNLRTTAIVDHNFSKTAVTSQESLRTGPQTTELLENLVRNRSTQVADALRSTWLS